MTKPLASRACADAVRSLYQGEIEVAQQALGREDAESLHDFRIALRRLQVVVENYADEGRPRRRVLRRLKWLIRQTNRGRDSEVMLAWLEQVRSQLGEASSSGVHLWQRSLQRHRHSSTLPLARSYSCLARLAPRLAMLPVRAEFVEISFGEAAALRLGLHAVKLHSLLQEGEGSATLHQLRLKVKTLRYLLLPFREVLNSGRDGEERLHQLQDLLGGWHDSVICRQNLTQLLAKRIKRLAQRIDRALAHGTPLNLIEISPELEGLLNLARVNRTREQQALASIRRHCLHSAGESLDVSLRQALAALQQVSAG